MGIQLPPVGIRPWNIAEQVVEDPTTKLRLEFSSVHTDELTVGRPAPGHDQILYLRLWTTDRTRVATYAFTRGGAFIRTAVEHVDPGNHPKLDDGIEHAPVLRPHDASGNVSEAELAREAMVYNEDHIAPHDAGQLSEVTGGFEDINLAKTFTGDI